ncbi:uncharacterized protein LOC144119270 [Amblyomma americanum]
MHEDCIPPTAKRKKQENDSNTPDKAYNTLQVPAQNVSSDTEDAADLLPTFESLCIGSRVAPVLADIFLSRVDREIEKALDGVVVRIFRYVDDYLVFTRTGSFTRSLVDVLKTFKECGRGLEFTTEVPSNKEQQFLDLALCGGKNTCVGGIARERPNHC